MRNLLQPGRASAHPLWVRLAACAALLLLLLFTSAQAAHIHGEWMPHSAHQASPHPDSPELANPDNNCLLCMAMHAVLTGGSDRASATSIPTYRVSSAPLRVPPAPEWHYTLFSRPPPSSVL